MGNIEAELTRMGYMVPNIHGLIDNLIKKCYLKNGFAHNLNNPSKFWSNLMNIFKHLLILRLQNDPEYHFPYKPFFKILI